MRSKPNPSASSMSRLRNQRVADWLRDNDKYGVVISGTMVVERVQPSQSFDHQIQMSNRQRGTQAKAPSPTQETPSDEAPSPRAPPRSMEHTPSKSSDPIHRPQTTSTTDSTDGDEEEQRHRRRQPSARRSLVRQEQAEGPPGLPGPTGPPSPPPRAPSRGFEAGPVELPAYPSPRPMRGHTPVVEVVEEPDDLFFIVKELVLTERTFLRDLELVAVRLPAALMALVPRRLEPPSDSEGTSEASVSGAGCLCSLASATLHPLLNFHRAFAAELESRLCAWTASCSAVADQPLTVRHQTALLQIGDILMSLTTVLHLYRSYLARLLGLLWSPQVGADLAMLAEAMSTGHDPSLAAFYLSPALLLCRPAHRLLAYRHLLATYVAHLSPTHPDSLDASALLARLSDLLAGSASVLGRVDSARVLLELRATLGGARDERTGTVLSVPLSSNSDLVRLGCLHKLTRKGYQPRLFVLLSDTLLYAARASGPTGPGFRLHSHITLRDLSLVGSAQSLDAEPGRLQLIETTTGRRLHLVATSIGDWRRWAADLRLAISCASAGISATTSASLSRRARFLSPPQHGPMSDSAASLSPPVHPSEPSTSSPEGHLSSPRTAYDDAPPQATPTGVGGVSLAHVCWHRALSLGADDVRLAGTGAQLSSYLLRKFKSAPGWQKLWVVLAADCALHFFKSCYDPTPLASLPLLGYSVSPVTARSESPAPGSAGHQLVFKLHFKSHVYLFRAESRYTFCRWLEAIRCATLAWWTAEQAGPDTEPGADDFLQPDRHDDVDYIDDEDDDR